MEYTKISRKYLLAAETFSYSYANYADHIGINQRFDKYMPEDLAIIEDLVKQGKGADEIAQNLEVSKEIGENLLKSYIIAKDIVYARDAAESFRRGVKASIGFALEDGLNNEDDIEKLVGQICYRAADFAYLLDLEGKELSDYSEILRE